ncbi:hypothetical protein ANN_01217 [Periplaneta americana]|uniref:Phosphoinositide phospholipase C n=1 Tax=Periplaneta americana TaxID=6978 RepID=A0ABQ8TUL1_PERAM|nr:hypothetical protein ANN_01217 [Periplaneta americana]
MAGLCEGGNELAGSLKAIKRTSHLAGLAIAAHILTARGSERNKDTTLTLLLLDAYCFKTDVLSELELQNSEEAWQTWKAKQRLKLTVKAVYDYQARRDDELSFCKHAIISNVSKQDDGWWRGDYGGKKQHWFPSNYVEVVEPQDNREDNRAFRRKFNVTPPTRKSIYHWNKQFDETGSLNKGKSPGRPRVSEENVDRIRATFERSPMKSTRRASRELGLPQTTVWRVLRRRLMYKPYHLQLLQALRANDKIGRMGNADLALQFWPPRSPDLTVCDFFLWGYVKDAVYVPPLPMNLNELRNRLTAAVNSVTQDILQRVWDEFSYRLDVVRAAGGGSFRFRKQYHAAKTSLLPLLKNLVKVCTQAYLSKACLLRQTDAMLLGSLQKGSLDMMGAVVELAVGGRPGMEWILKIQNPSMLTPFEVAVPSREHALEWMVSIKEIAQNASVRETHHKDLEKQWRIAAELSNLIVYCQAVTFNIERIRKNGFVIYEMSSFPETKAEKLICQQENKFFLKYHQNQFSRVYPKGQRIDSSNYNPIPIWNSGGQMVALNYQTPDKYMQLNQAKFRENGNCGYLLKPEFMFREDFSPYNKKTLVGVEPLRISIRVIGARHLGKSGRGTSSPSVEIEVIGADYDSGSKLTTKTVSDNGFNPVWNEICGFNVINPHFALLRFVIQDEDMFGDSNFIGQATYPSVALYGAETWTLRRSEKKRIEAFEMWI